MDISPKLTRSKCHLCCISLDRQRYQQKPLLCLYQRALVEFAIGYSLKPLLILFKIKVSWILYSPVNWGLLLTSTEIWKTVIMNQPKSSSSCLCKWSRTEKVQHVYISSLIALQASHPYTGSVFKDPVDLCTMRFHGLSMDRHKVSAFRTCDRDSQALL